jgi:hypothetical protein
MKTIKRTIYSKKDFSTVITPSWQRWRNKKNVKDLAEAVSENGQMRDVLICVTTDGTRWLTDGAHLVDAMTNRLKSREIRVLEKFVKDEEEARKTFISFNTRGKTLNTIDYVVSYAGSGNKTYQRFLKEVMQSPKNEKEANNVHGKLFTVPSLINLFLGDNKRVRQGVAKLPSDYEKMLEVVEYVAQNYLFNGKLLVHTKKNGSRMRLNGTSTASFLRILSNRRGLSNFTNKEVLDMMIDFTIYHYNSNTSCTYTRDAVEMSFKEYLNIR